MPTKKLIKCGVCKQGILLDKVAISTNIGNREHIVHVCSRCYSNPFECHVCGKFFTTEVESTTHAATHYCTNTMNYEDNYTCLNLPDDSDSNIADLGVPWCSLQFCEGDFRQFNYIKDILFFLQEGNYVDGGRSGIVGRCFASSPGTNYNSEIVCEADKGRFADREETDLAFLMTKILSSSTVSF